MDDWKLTPGRKDSLGKRRKKQIIINTSIDFVLSGSQDSPVFNPVIYVKNWNAESARIMVDDNNTGGKETGIHHKLEGTDLVVFLWMESDAKINVRILPE